MQKSAQHWRNMSATLTASKETTRWEYMAVHVRKLAEDELKRWGEEGWELVAASEQTVYFKRPL
jgi:hypothetical protein